MRAGCIRALRTPAWCVAHHAYFVDDRSFCWATVRPTNVDPLNALPDDLASIVPASRPVVDDRGMVLVWIGATLAFVAALALALVIVAGRPAGG